MSLDTPTPLNPQPVVIYDGAGNIVFSASIALAEDSPHVSGDSGVMLLGVRNDAASAGLTTLTGDYSPVAVNDRGAVFVVGPKDAGVAPIGGIVQVGGIGVDAPAADVAANTTIRLTGGRDGVLHTRERPRTPWSITHAPAAAAQATISRASAGVGLKNVMLGFMITIIASGATTAETVIINIRDGATGAGTVLWSMAIEVPTLAGAGSVPGSPFGMNNIYLVGTAATAMTIETSAAPGANIAVRVNAWGEVTG